MAVAVPHHSPHKSESQPKQTKQSFTLTLATQALPSLDKERQRAWNWGIDKKPEGLLMFITFGLPSASAYLRSYETTVIPASRRPLVSSCSPAKNSTA